MNRSRFIQGLKGDIQLSEKERRRIIRKSLQKYSWKTKCTVAMEEFAELQQQVSKQVRGYGDRIGLLEEMADAYICLNFLESIFDIKPEDLQKAIKEKFLMIWGHDISFEGFQRIVDEWYRDKDFELCDPPINAQYALDLIFKTLIDDKENYPYLTTMPESTEQSNSIMLDLILRKYSRQYRKFRQQQKGKL